MAHVIAITSIVRDVVSESIGRISVGGSDSVVESVPGESQGVAVVTWNRAGHGECTLVVRAGAGRSVSDVTILDFESDRGRVSCGTSAGDGEDALGKGWGEESRGREKES